MPKVLFSIFRKGVNALRGSGIGKVPFVMPLYESMFQILRPKTTAMVHGHEMFLDKEDSLHLTLSDNYEPSETAFFFKKIKKGDVVLDIGANIGYYTLISARLVGNKGKVYAFEPDPTNFAVLKKNIEHNGYKNVVLVNKALSDKKGKLRLFLADKNKGDHRLYDSKDGRKSVNVDVVSLDYFFKNKKSKINFVKIDVQGFEVNVLKGMQKTVKKNKSMIFLTEYWPIGLKRAGSNGKEYLSLLKKQGFKLNELMCEGKTRKLDEKFLHGDVNAEKENYTNLICLKNT